MSDPYVVETRNFSPEAVFRSHVAEQDLDQART